MARVHGRHEPNTRGLSSHVLRYQPYYYPPEPSRTSPPRDQVADLAIEAYLRGSLKIPYTTPLNLYALPDSPVPRPTTASLMQLAIWGSPNKRLTLAQIYEHIKIRYGLSEAIPKKWRDTIRHDLSEKKIYKRADRPAHDPGKGGYWELDPDNLGNARTNPPKAKIKTKPDPPPKRGRKPTKRSSITEIPTEVGLPSSSSRSNPSLPFNSSRYLPTPTRSDSGADLIGLPSQRPSLDWDAAGHFPTEQPEDAGVWNHGYYQGPSPTDPETSETVTWTYPQLQGPEYMGYSQMGANY